ncbi:MAG: hypothetical protein LBE14_03860 [Treponema sp.]|jgi:hypothetical protein|nr:hypothetical protein [Treponema sp.]
MSFRYSLFILAALSLLTGLLLWLLAAFLTPRVRAGAYAVLELDAALPDRHVRELLNDEEALSESSQWVFLDDFSGLRRIPLDQYPALVSSFDPRNDGFAERLRAFFVREDRRLVYIPLDRRPGAAGRLERGLAASLAGIPFRLEYTGGGKPLTPYLALLFAAGLGVLWFTRRLVFVPCLPVLAGLSFAGAPGLALAAFLMGLGGLLLEPGEEYFVCLRYKKTRLPFGPFENRPLGELLSPFRNRLFLAPVFAGALALCSVFGGVHPLLTLAAGLGFGGIYGFSLWVFSRRGEAQDHVRFSPVLILKAPALHLGFSRFMAPYALAALAAVPLGFLVPGPAPGSPVLQDLPAPVGEAEYRSHAAFQAFFSLRPLGREAGGLSSGESRGPVYSRYILGDDGLIAGKTEVLPGEAGGVFPDDIPPFPLKSLMEALEQRGKAAGGGPGLFWGELAPVFIALILPVPVFGKLRRGDKKRKNRLLYSVCP